MQERELRRLFRAAIIGASTLGACGGEEAGDDASTFGPDATRDAMDSSFEVQFGSPDAFAWCDAGPPDVVASCGSCCRIYDVPCGIPPSQHADDAGRLYGCDSICGANFVEQTGGGCSIFGATSGYYGEDAATFDFDADTYVVCGCTGRRPAGYRESRAPTNLGEYFAGMARLEAASVFAFGRLRAELEELDAPPNLVARAQRSIADEARHTRMVARIARRFGGVVAMPRAPRFRERAAEPFAIENAVEGCVNETYGALVATWQSMHAGDVGVRAVMRAIARDETRHAALAMSVAAFASNKLDARSRARVARARLHAIRGLREAVAQSPHRELVRVAGVPTSAQAVALAGRFFGR